MTALTYITQLSIYFIAFSITALIQFLANDSEEEDESASNIRSSQNDTLMNTP